MPVVAGAGPKNREPPGVRYIMLLPQSLVLVSWILVPSGMITSPCGSVVFLPQPPVIE
jgi:hypothetical protein